MKDRSLPPYIVAAQNLVFIKKSLSKLEQSAKDDPYLEKEVKRVGRFSKSFFLLLAALFFSAFSFYLDFNCMEIATLKNWFAPSGAVVVIFSAWLEWCHTQMQYETLWSLSDSNKTPDQSENVLRMTNLVDGLQVFGLISLLLGTSIWAYGDKVVELNR